MKPLRLRLTNFRSFVKEQTFTFPTQPGLYFMWGDNQAEPRLEGNAAGKSTLWKALTWLFYGKTSEGLKAGDACNWDVGKGTRVELDYEMWGVNLTVGRTWSPNSWYLIAPNGHKTDLAKDPTNACLEELALGFKSFLFTILMAQGQPSFLDLDPGTKAALFAEVMALDKWLEYSTKASEKARELDYELRSGESAVAALRGRLEAARTTSVDKQMEEWEHGRSLRLAGLEKEYTALLNRLETSKAKVSERELAEEEARARYKIALESVDDAEAQLKRAKAGDYGVKGAHSCPTCGQSVPEAVSVLIEKVSAAKTKARNALRDMDDAVAALRHAERDVLSIDKVLDDLEARSDAISEEPNPYAKMHAAARDAVVDLEAALEAAVDRQDALSARFSILSGWVRWFKEIRLSLISETLEELEIEVNSCVAALGLVDWELRFDVDKETAKGTLQRGFTVSVLSPHNTKPVPWEAWSGGEGQRLRVAATMGLSNLIRARTGCKLDLEVWDEPTQYMSAQGVTDLLDSLATRARDEQRQIWIVDHRTLGYANFAGSVGVIKTREGSSFVVGSAYRSEGTSSPLRRRARTP